ncbi:uncharacterized protein LOC111322669 [Stylophora pistillata]|uniref:Nuclear receptor coactivator 6 TRADD-N domain-containing protein n=1 Tax=Stylophora pistillata TaxID=50429 RepID=A0A2B4SRF1_STYPI|nr:uncharacterized protein LOC111322669 [Stylophora pistillata]PFX31112.1 hypothetical protein AWC38_SpisGene4054 [Stylophora pistillata]
MRNPTGSHRDTPLTVSFPVPKKAANKLRSLAISKDRRLLDLGVLAVQINEGESIVLGIKLGRRKLKRTEVESDKIMGNACRGRVTKRHSSLRNLGTVHHMPTSLSLADKPVTAQITSFSPTSHSDQRKASLRAGKSDGDALANELFSSMILGSSDKSTNGSNLQLSGYKTPNDSRGLSANGVLSSSKNTVSRLNISQNNGDLASGRGSSSSESNLRKSSYGTRRSSRETPPSPVVLSGSRFLADRRLSSPNSQRANSASPCSESSSTSSDENLDEEVHQLIYNCYIDQSKYSAADMLKQLARAHSGTKETTKSTMGNTSVSSSVVKTVTVTPKSSSHSGISLGQPRISENNKRAAITGSYREHVKNIRCYSLTSLTTSTVTVNSTLNVPSSKNAQADTSQSCRASIITDSLSFGERNLPTKPPTTLSTPSKPCSSSQTPNILTSSSETMSAYCEGRKVLWSSANVFPVKRSTLGSSIETSFSETATSLLQASKVSSPSISAQIDATIPSQTTTSVTLETKNGIHISNKVPGEELAKESKVVPSDLKTVIVKTPALALDSQESVTDSPQVAEPPTTLPVTNVQTTVSQGTKYVQNLTLARSTLPAANVVIAGTNTQTTWSNQQVSPTYILGAQTQYGIYPAMYNTDVNNNQLTQQAVPAGYPLNYVYPIGFVYPYLSVAQPSSAKNPNGEKVKQEKGDTDVEKSDTSVLDGAAMIPRNESSTAVHQGSSLNSADLVSTNSNTAPMQTQFIDLASSMRYWQQLNLLYRNRLQALTPGSPSNVATLPSSEGNTTSAAVISTSDSNSVVCGTAAQSSLQESAFSKSELSHSNISRGSYSEILKSVRPKEGSALEQSELKDSTNDRPSVIVAASCKDSTIKMENNCNKTQFEGQKLKEMNETFSPKFHSGKLQHFSEEDLAERRSRVSTPTLSFVHDSSIAYVNIGNSSGNGHSQASYSGNHVGTRRTSLGAHEDSVIRPAKRKKAKRSL